MTYAVMLAPAAQRQFRKLDSSARRRIQEALEPLAIDPRPPAAIQPVGGEGEWRVRTGDSRIVYEIHDGQLTVLVLAAGHRRETYDRRLPDELLQGGLRPRRLARMDQSLVLMAHWRCFLVTVSVQGCSTP